MRAVILWLNGELIDVANRTHVAVWTDPMSDQLQMRIAQHLRRSRQSP
jgi:hypothetical protein